MDYLAPRVLLGFAWVLVSGNGSTNLPPTLGEPLKGLSPPRAGRNPGSLADPRVSLGTPRDPGPPGGTPRDPRGPLGDPPAPLGVPAPRPPGNPNWVTG